MFDTVDHDIIPKIRQECGVSGIELAWFTSCLQADDSYASQWRVSSPIEEIHFGVS